MISKVAAIEFVKHRKGLLPAVLTSYLVVTFLLSFYLPHLAQRGQLVVLVKLFAGTFIPLLMSISIIQTVQPDRVAGNFMLTTHLTNPYFDWGEMQVVTHWVIHSVLAVTSYSILSHLTHVTINWLPLVLILNLLMVAQITYLLSRNLNSALAYLVVVAATMFALIAETPLFDHTMFFMPMTWLIRYSYMMFLSINRDSALITIMILFISINVFLILVNYLVSKIKPFS